MTAVPVTAATASRLRWPNRRTLHFSISSLGSVLYDSEAVYSVRAEDASGSFVIWPGHVDLLTVLTVGVLSWRQPGSDPALVQSWQHCAVRRGVLSLQGGCELAIATREAVLGDDLEQLQDQVLTQLSARSQAEDEARRSSRELEIRALRQLVRRTQAQARTAWP